MKIVGAVVALILIIISGAVITSLGKLEDYQRKNDRF